MPNFLSWIIQWKEASILPLTSLHGWESLPSLKGEEELQHDHFLEQFIYLKTRLETTQQKLW